MNDIGGSSRDDSAYHASRIRVTGGIFSNPLRRIRHQVAINRSYHTAAVHRKFDLESLCHNSKVSLTLEIQEPDIEEETALEQVLAEMRLGLVSLGGRKAAGYGAFTVEFTKEEFDLESSKGVKTYLLNEHGKLQKMDNWIKRGEPAAILSRVSIDGDNTIDRCCRLMISFDLFFPELFLFNDPLESAVSGSDHAAVLDADGIPWLPPSTIRGIMRSRCEQILRTLNNKSACDPSIDTISNDLCSCAAHIKTKKKVR